MTIVRWAVRLLCLAAAVFLAIGGPLPAVAVRVVPGLSPLAAAASSLAHLSWYLALFWAAPSAVMLIAAVWKGRLFCRWICPAGTVYSIPRRLSLKKPLLRLRLNAFLFWTILFASVIGVPLVLFLDPLSTFNRLTPVLRGTYTIASLVPGVILPLFLLLGFLQPMLWCTHFCPLGYSLEFSRSVRRHPVQTFSRTRRSILAGLVVGAPAAVLTRKFLLAKDSYDRPPVLPPGARDVESFAATCTRCYACVSVCPSKIIRVHFDLDRAAAQLFQPEMHYFDSGTEAEAGYCPESCNQCSDVCPAGALSALTFAQKWHRQIGVAKIIRTACLAWQDEEDCSVCQEVCPYAAIKLDYTPEGRALPSVDRERCRGCGFCHSKCPAIREGKAIIVEGVDAQGWVCKDEPAPAPLTE